MDIDFTGLVGHNCVIVHESIRVAFEGKDILDGHIFKYRFVFISFGYKMIIFVHIVFPLILRCGSVLLGLHHIYPLEKMLGHRSQ